MRAVRRYPALALGDEEFKDARCQQVSGIFVLGRQAGIDEEMLAALVKEQLSSVIAVHELVGRIEVAFSGVDQAVGQLISDADTGREPMSVMKQQDLYHTNRTSETSNPTDTPSQAVNCSTMAQRQ